MEHARELARNVLALMDEISTLIESLEGEPVWQVRHLIAEPEFGKLEAFAQNMAVVKAQLASMYAQGDAMRALADGSAELEDLTPNAVAIMEGLAREGVPIREDFARMLAWAREMKDPEKVARVQRLN